MQSFWEKAKLVIFLQSNYVILFDTGTQSLSANTTWINNEKINKVLGVNNGTMIEKCKKKKNVTRSI